MRLFNFKTSASLLFLTVSSFISLSILLDNTANPSPAFVNITFGLMGFLMALSVMYMGSMVTAKWMEDQEFIADEYMPDPVQTEVSKKVTSKQMA